MVSALAALALLGSGFANLTQQAEVMEGITRLGYPEYFPQILGAWKILAAVAILAPGFARLKEWAYAGVTFALSGAFFSHLMAGDALAQALPPLVILGFAVASYALRPANRRLASTPSTSDGMMQPAFAE